MTGKDWFLWLPLVLFAGIVTFFLLDLSDPAERTVESAMVGKSLPQFDLPPAASGVPALSRADFAGKPRLLNVFGSWCVPCAVEAPQLEVLRQRGAEINAVAIRDRREDVDAFLARYGNPFARIGSDERSEVQIELGSSGVPETFVIDGSGTIRYQHVGEIRPEHVDLLLAELEKAEAS